MAPETQEQTTFADTRSYPIDVMQLPETVLNGLRSKGWTSLGDVADHTEMDLLSEAEWVGQTQLGHIKHELQKFGLTLHKNTAASPELVLDDTTGLEPVSVPKRNYYKEKLMKLGKTVRPYHKKVGRPLGVKNKPKAVVLTKDLPRDREGFLHCPECKAQNQDVQYVTVASMAQHRSSKHGVHSVQAHEKWYQRRHGNLTPGKTRYEIVADRMKRNAIATTKIQPNAKGVYYCPECKLEGEHIGFNKRASLGNHRLSKHGVKGTMSWPAVKAKRDRHSSYQGTHWTQQPGNKERLKAMLSARIKNKKARLEVKEGLAPGYSQTKPQLEVLEPEVVLQTPTQNAEFIVGYAYAHVKILISTLATESNGAISTTELELRLGSILSGEVQKEVQSEHYTRPQGWPIGGVA